MYGMGRCIRGYLSPEHAAGRRDKYKYGYLEYFPRSKSMIASPIGLCQIAAI